MRLKINTCNKPGKLSFFLRSEINTWNQPGQLSHRPTFSRSQINTCSNQKILAIPSGAKTSNYQSPSRMKTLILSSSQDIQIFPSEDLLKTGIPSRLAYNPRSWFPNNSWGTSHFQRSKDSQSPTAVQDLLSLDSSQDSFISSYPGFVFLSKTAHQPTCAFITFTFINIDITYIASYISCNMTLCFS